MEVFAIVILMAIVFTKVSFQMKTLLSALAMGIFALLALTSFDVYDLYVIEGVSTRVLMFTDYDAVAIAWFNALGFFIVLILFVVNALLSLASYRTPLWRKRIDEHRKALSDD